MPRLNGQPAPPETEGGKYSEILEAAADLFAAHGFDGVSFRDITAVTGTKRPLILYHFKSKEELWQCAMRHIVKVFDAAMSACPVPGPEASDRERIENVLRNFLVALSKVPQFGQVLLREGVAEGPRLDWIIRNFVPAVTVHFRLSDQALNERTRQTMVRHVVLGSTLFATALAPLLEGSLAVASRQESAGLYPLSEQRREELIAILTNLILG